MEDVKEYKGRLIDEYTHITVNIVKLSGFLEKDRTNQSIKNKDYKDLLGKQLEIMVQYQDVLRYRIRMEMEGDV